MNVLPASGQFSATVNESRDEAGVTSPINPRTPGARYRKAKTPLCGSVVRYEDRPWYMTQTCDRIPSTTPSVG
jgi:hypothetical protein